MNVQAAGADEQVKISPLPQAAAEAIPESKLAQKVRGCMSSTRGLFARNCLSSVSSLYGFLPGMSSLDVGFRMLLKTVSTVSKTVSGNPLFAKETLLTIKQRERLADIETKKQILEDKEVLSLCRKAGTLVDETIPIVASDILGEVPAWVEGVATYSAWAYIPFFSRIGARYINYQLQKRADLYESIRSAVAHVFGRSYSGLTSRYSEAVITKSLTGPWVDFEHLALIFCTKLQELHMGMEEDLKRSDPNDPKVPKNVGLVLRALAIVMSRQAAIDAFIKAEGLQDERAQFIARLEWHKRDKSLPPGLPDPSKVTLTPENLSFELKAALMRDMTVVVEKVLNKFAPSGMRNNLLYWLEGKDMLVKVFTTLFVELGVEQLVNPHNFCLLVLSAAGYKTLQFELDKFGKGTNDHLFKTAQGMLKAALADKPDSEAIVRQFIESELKAAPGGLGAEKQKQEVRALVTRYVSDMITAYMGGSSNRPQEPQAEGVGITGFANLALQVLIRTTVYSYKAVQGTLKKGQTLSGDIQKGIADGTNVIDTLANQVVSLIYHPSWRVTVLYVIDAAVQALTVPEHKKEITEEDCRKYFGAITKFLYGHVTLDMFAKLAKGLTGEAAYSAFKSAVQPKKDSPLLSKVVPIALPIVEELLLYERVTQFMRERNVSVPADSKFWESYVREYLDRVESFSLSDKYTEFAIDQADARREIREKAAKAFSELSRLELVRTLVRSPSAYTEFRKPQLPVVKVEPPPIKVVAEPKPQDKKREKMVVCGSEVEVDDSYSGEK